ncbi:uncharacterized protein LOC131680072 [Topomyia yanbarensis]|uniref:uncharacterized protein LOC131680072 n=1 Tax=Topomyia yanbarensis TaxID=2498891 RepID=UPI00273B49C9|nr:uncharacterized protein LOC131680072 [Topomyia yanbarensis]
MSDIDREVYIGKLQQRLSNLQESTSFLENFLKKYKPEENLGQVQVRLEKLEEFFVKFSDVAAELESYSTDKYPINLKKDRFAFESLYYSIKSGLLSKLPKSEPPSLPPSSAASGSAIVHSHIRYSELPLVKFSGRPEDWVSFRDSFVTGVVNRAEIHEIDKVQYLKGLVQGDAARLIGHIELSEEGYESAWQLLKRRYESKRRLVFCHLQALYETPPMQKESNDELLRLIDSFEEHLSKLKRLGEPVNRWSSSLVYHVYVRLDSNTKREWDRHCNAVDSLEHDHDSLNASQDIVDEMPAYTDMIRFLQGYAKVLPSSKQVSSSKGERPFKGNSSVRYASHFTANSNQTSSSIPGCYQCGQKHYIYQCPDFRKLSIGQRYELVDCNGLCNNCLRTTKHTARSCPSRNCNRCSKKHNTLLHDSRADQQRGQQNQQPASGSQNQLGAHQQASTSAGPSNQNQQSGSRQQGSQSAGSQVVRQAQSTYSATPAIQCSYATQTKHQDRIVLLPTAFINVEDKMGKLTRSRCVLDSASQCHFISNDLCNKLKLPRKRVPLPIIVSGIGCSSASVTHYVVAEISSFHSNFRANLRMLVLPNVTIKIPIQDVDSSDRVDVIIGAEHFFSVLQYGRIELGKNLPLLQNTHFGWVVSGGCGNEDPQVSLHSTVYLGILEDLVKRFWQLETFHDLREWSIEERACEKHFVINTVRNEVGRYVVKLPRREDIFGQLRDNRYNAERRRVEPLERRLEANAELKAQYHQFITEYEELGHMREVDSGELDTNPQYFLPHHAVLRPESSTTKLRTVFDASCKSKSGLSLNDVLMPGPTVQDSLVAIVLRFRMHPFVVAADVTKMYRQILVDPSDQPLQRIFWRFSADEPLKIYQLLTVTYGTNCAPFLATRVLQKLAEDEAPNYPLAASVVRKDFYIDDMLTGSDSVRGLRETIKQVIDMISSAGFSLRNWSSNSPEVLVNIPVEFQESKTELELDHESSTTTLGLRWVTTSDELRFKQPKWSESETLTKRVVLSQLASLFDPLGLIGPALSKAKIFIQTLWKLQIDWDTPLPTSFQEEWREFQCQIYNIEQLSVPREDNPADLISRGLDVTALLKSSLWWNGPMWLITTHVPWPAKFNVTDKASRDSPEFESRKAVALPTIAVQEDVDLISRFSTLHRLLSVFAWGLRFAYNCRATLSKRRSGPLTIEEKQEALIKLVRRVQEEHFPAEFAALQKQKPVSRSSRLRFLKPRLVDGLIRVGGRLQHSKIAIDAKHPLVLPGKDHLTKLIARAKHFKTLHGGPQLLLSTIHQRFWPLGGRDMVRRLVHSCVTCTRVKPQTLEQLMGNLPRDRITSSHVFENVGVDFAGPMYIRSGIRRVQTIKAYVAVFVCLATKALHLESHKNAVINFCEPDNIRFHFIPPRSPSFGELWEACVKSMKFHLRRIVGNATLNKEDCETVLAEVEACLNSRPITPLSTDPSDLQALTPGHFIIGRPLNALPEPDLTATPPNRLAAWERCQQIAHLVIFHVRYRRPPRYDLELLKQPNVATAYAQHLEAALPGEGDLDVAPLEDCWRTVKAAINNVAENIVGYEERRRRSDWFDEECRAVLEEKNAARAVILQHGTRQNVERYKQKRRQQTRLFREKKRRLKEAECEEMELLFRSQNTRKFYQKLNASRKGFVPQAEICRDKNKSLLTDNRELAQLDQSTNTPAISPRFVVVKIFERTDSALPCVGTERALLLLLDWLLLPPSVEAAGLEIFKIATNAAAMEERTHGLP